MSGTHTSSTARVQRFRQRQLDAGKRRMTLYLDRDTQRGLDRLGGEEAQARYLGTLVKAAIKREWSALESQRKDSQRIESSNPARENGGDWMARFPGRRRSFAEEQAGNARVACNGAAQRHR